MDLFLRELGRPGRYLVPDVLRRSGFQKIGREGGKKQVIAILNPKPQKKHLPLFLASVMLKIT